MHPFLWIQSGRRLIQNKNLRIIQHRLGNSQSPFHPSGKSFDLSVSVISKPRHIQKFLNPPLRRMLVQPF